MWGNDLSRRIFFQIGLVQPATIYIGVFFFVGEKIAVIYLPENERDFDGKSTMIHECVSEPRGVYHLRSSKRVLLSLKKNRGM